MNLPSKTLEEAVDAIATLPGIGKKTALRLVLHLLKEENSVTYQLTDSLTKLKSNIKYCKECHNISDDEVCSICASAFRDNDIICVISMSI